MEHEPFVSHDYESTVPGPRPCLVCAKLTRSRTRICSRACHKKQAGYTSGNPIGQKVGITQDQVEEMFKMRAAFQTINEIAEHFSVSPSTVQRYLKQPRPSTRKND